MTKAETQAEDYRRDARERQASAPPEASGLRTERVVLELVIDDNQLPARWPWDRILRPFVLEHKGESVRVMEAVIADAYSVVFFPDRTLAEQLATARTELSELRQAMEAVSADAYDVSAARIERDTSLEERDVARLQCQTARNELDKERKQREEQRQENNLRYKISQARVAELESERDDRVTIDEVAHQRDTLQARLNRLEVTLKGETVSVARLGLEKAFLIRTLVRLQGDVRAAEKEADNLRGQLESLADRAAAETALESAPAASGAAGTWPGVVEDLIAAAETVRDWAGQPLKLNTNIYRSAVDDLGVAIHAAAALLVNPQPAVPSSDALKARVAELEAEKAAAILDRKAAQSLLSRSLKANDSMWSSILVVADERDAAIREREEFRRSFHWSEEAGTRLVAERDTALDDADGLRDRVAELESAPAASDAAFVVRGLTSIIYTYAATDDERRAAVAALVECVCPGWSMAPAASDEAGTVAVSCKPVAWGIIEYQGGSIIEATPCADEATQYAGETVPLYAAPQPAKGWLTAEEREAILYLIANRSQFAPKTPHEERRNAACRVCHALLGRSSPPEVVLGECPFTPDSTHAMGWWEAIGKVRAALAAAGVTVKEVGRE